MIVIARMVIAGIGIAMLGMAVGLVNPAFILSFIGFRIVDPALAAYQLGEVRAVYGGLFAVIGIFTVLSAIDPIASGSRLFVLGWCWLGLAGGRLLGAILDGNPGLRGWVFTSGELAAGILVLVCMSIVNGASRRGTT